MENRVELQLGAGAPARFEQVADILAERIDSGLYPVGTTLPTQGILVGVFGVSATVIRRAMRKLHSDGLIRVQQGHPALILRRPSETLPREATADRLYVLRALDDVSSMLAKAMASVEHMRRSYEAPGADEDHERT